MSIPRGLSEAEAAAWAKLAQSVTPFEGRAVPNPVPSVGGKLVEDTARVRPAASERLREKPRISASRHQSLSPPSGQRLDGSWDRRIKSGDIAPDFTLDLHGHSLDSAYERLMSGLDQARAMDARVVLLITGKSRPVDPADRSERRGAIRAKFLDWLAASRHADAISAIRKAHQRHGGRGALYLVLKRQR